MLENIINVLERVKQEQPLIHQITNYVSMNDCANVTLAVGASPVMTSDIEEVSELVPHVSALVVNLGTLQSPNIKAMFVAGRRAKDLSIPVVLDPVGAGATSRRTAVARRFIQEIQPEIIRCNMSELKVLCGADVMIKGVDSATTSEGGETAAMCLAERTGSVVAVTGAVDLICGGGLLIKIANGHPYLTRVTGTGCMTTALAASCAATGNVFAGAAAGVLCMGISGEVAAASLTDGEGIGTFKIRLIDAIFCLNRDIIKRCAKLL